MGNEERRPLTSSSRCHERQNKGATELANSLGKSATYDEQEMSPNKDERKKKSVLAKFKDGTFTKRSIAIIILCSLGSFSDGCVFSILAPFFPLKAEQKGASATFIGVLFAVFQLIATGVSPFFGSHITQLGAKFLYVSGMFVSGVSTLLFGLLDQSPPGVTFMALSFSCRCVQAIGMAGMLTAGFAIVSSEFPNNVATVFGIYQTIEAIGLMAGPTVGGVLYELGGFALPFIVLGIVVLLNGFLIYIFLPPPRDIKPQKKQSILTLLRSPLVFLCFLCNTSFAFGLAFLDPTLASHLEKFHLSPLLIGIVFVIAPGIHAIMAPFWGYVTDRKNIQSPLIVIGELLLCVGMLGVGPCPWLPFLPFELWTINVGLLLYGVGAGMVLIADMKCFLLGSFELGFEDNLQTYGIVSGVYTSSFALGATIGPLFGGIMTETIGFRFSASLLAGFHLIMTASSFLFFTFRRARRRKADETDMIVHYQLGMEEIKTSSVLNEEDSFY